MAIPRRVERIVGLFVLVPILALAALVLMSGKNKGWFENKLKIEATFDEGMALRQGASTVMEGVNIGWVDSVEFDPENKVKVCMRIRRRFASQIRTDSLATITKLNILGEPVVVISKGSPDKPPVDDGVEIQTRATREVQAQEVRLLLLDTIDLVSRLNSERSSMGRFLRDDGKLYEDMNKMIAAGNRILENAPPVPIVLTPDSTTTVYLNAHLQKQVDDLVAVVQRLDKLIVGVEEGEGTLGKLITDPELYNQITNILKESRQLVSDLQVTAGYLKQAAPGIPILIESGDSLIKRADGLLERIEVNPLIGGGPQKKDEKPPVQIEERFRHYPPDKPKQEE